MGELTGTHDEEDDDDDDFGREFNGIEGKKRRVVAERARLVRRALLALGSPAWSPANRGDPKQ